MSEVCSSKQEDGASPVSEGQDFWEKEVTEFGERHDLASSKSSGSSDKWRPSIM